MKLIDADKLIAEIEKRYDNMLNRAKLDSENANYWNGKADAYRAIYDHINSLQHEQPTKGYDEKYLNEKIAKAKKSWDGVDVDKFMDDVRGREQQEQLDNEDIDKVAQELYEHLYELKRRNNVPTNLYDKQEIIDLWKAGVEYGRNHTKQEQPEVDLEKEIFKAEKKYGDIDEMGGYQILLFDDEFRDILRYFYELGKNARKEE